MKTKGMTKKEFEEWVDDPTYCEYCGKMVAKPDKLYIAGTICRGHTLSVLQYIKWKLGKFIGKFFK